MTLDTLFIDMRSLYTLISFAVFVCIALWVYGARRSADFDAAANLPFAEQSGEKRDG